MIRNPNRNIQLQKIIQKNPGIKFREIMRLTGLKIGTLSYHLAKLEKHGDVQVYRKPRETRYYSLRISKSEFKTINALRRETPRNIIRSLILQHEGLSFTEIVNQVSKSPSTVSLYLSKLIDDDIVESFYTVGKKYTIKNRYTLDRLIDEYHPGFLDKSISGFEDTINSL